MALARFVLTRFIRKFEGVSRQYVDLRSKRVLLRRGLRSGRASTLTVQATVGRAFADDEHYDDRHSRSKTPKKKESWLSDLFDFG